MKELYEFKDHKMIECCGHVFPNLIDQESADLHKQDPETFEYIETIENPAWQSLAGKTVNITVEIIAPYIK